MNDKLKELIKYLVSSAECESALLYPDPQHYNMTMGIFDSICTIWEIPKPEMTKIIDEIQEKRKEQEKC